MNDERFQDAKRLRPLSDNSVEIKYMSDEKFKKAMAEVSKTMVDFPSYKRTQTQSLTLSEEVEFFLLEFPNLRLGQVMATIIPEDRLFMFNVYDEEVIRRLRLFRDFMNGPNNSVDWQGYLEEHTK